MAAGTFRHREQRCTGVQQWSRRVRLIMTPKQASDAIAAMLAAAIVTNRGGRTYHDAIVSRELGLPCVVGAADATEVLRDIPTVTVDGGSGNVYRGDIADMLSPPETAVRSSSPVATRTKLYVNLADPNAARRVASLDVDGVGLLRAEFMIAHLGEHPRAMLESGRGDEFTRYLADGMGASASAFEPRPVVYRFSDFKTNEYRSLKGGEAFEPHEENPMIGYRGSARYLADPDLFDLEIQALLTARRRFSNLWAMVPFVRTTSELRSVISALARGGPERSPDFKVWMVV